jgi:bla regulator protein BlaR1
MKLRYACIVLVIVAGSARSQTGAAGARKFEVATVKPSNSSDTRPLFNMSTILSGGQFTAKNATVRRLIEIAYGTKSFQISGGPGWIGSELFDIAAKPDGQSTMDEFRSMLQSLLSERFGLIMGRETKGMPVYALVVRTTGSKLTEANGSGPNITRIRRGLIAAQGITAPGLCDTLSGIVGRTVIDKTNLKAKYDLRLEWTPDENETAMLAAMGVPETTSDTPARDPFGPSLFTALQDQLGLALQSQKGSVELLIIERIERPVAN